MPFLCAVEGRGICPEGVFPLSPSKEQQTRIMECQVWLSLHIALTALLPARIILSEMIRTHDVILCGYRPAILINKAPANIGLRWKTIWIPIILVKSHVKTYD